MATGVGSVTFPGSGSNYIDVSTIDFDSDWTVMAWCYSSSITATKAIICNDDTGNAALHISSNNIPHLENQFNATVTPVEAVATTNFTAAKWWYGAASHNSSALSATINVGDGNTNVTQESSQTYAGTPNAGGSTSPRIGLLASITAWNWGGQISQALVYTRTLSVAEMQEIQWNPASIPSSLSSWTPLFSSTVATDLSPNQSNGSITGSLANSSDGPPVFLLGGQ